MSECICAKECTATEHEYPQIDSDETFLDLLTELAALRSKYETLLENTRSRDETIAALRAERDRYRAALERIAAYSSYSFAGNGYKSIADDALNGGTDD